MAASPGARISSIRHAISILGRKQLQRWLQLLVFTNSNTAASVQRNPLMQLAAMRARFMEVLAERCYPGRKDLREPAFLTGLLSLMPAGLGMSLVDILANISVAPEVRRALSRHEGELGLLLELTEHYDNNDRAATDASLSKLGGRADLLALGECLGEVIAWIRPLDGDAGLA
jgi:EAL and modified HD-GYP domain-containing signal transduction protein